MESTSIPITVSVTIHAPLLKIWDYWNQPAHITNWCFASDDWHSPSAENDLQVGGSFTTRMEAKDGSFGFDFGGVYDEVIPNQLVSYAMTDGRTVRIQFLSSGNETHVSETFDRESENPVEMQRGGWQAIRDNFKKYVEAN